MYVCLEKDVSHIVEIEMSVFVEAHIVVAFAFLGLHVLNRITA